MQGFKHTLLDCLAGWKLEKCLNFQQNLDALGKQLKNKEVWQYICSMRDYKPFKWQWVSFSIWNWAFKSISYFLKSNETTWDSGLKTKRARPPPLKHNGEVMTACHPLGPSRLLQPPFPYKIYFPLVTCKGALLVLQKLLPLRLKKIVPRIVVYMIH